MRERHAMSVAYHPGWFGAFTREQAREARFVNGSRVCKDGSKPDDTHTDGAMATVLGSVHVPGSGCAYFVEFDTHPRCAVMITEIRLAWPGSQKSTSM